MEKLQPLENWSEAVEDLAAAGEIEGVIALLKSVVSNFEETLKYLSSDSLMIISQLQLVYPLSELATLYSSKGFSFKSDELQSRASLLKQTTQQQILPAIYPSLSLSLSLSPL